MSSIHPTPPAPESSRATLSGSAVRDAIGAVNARFMSAFADGDAAAVADCYTPDAQLLPANSDVVTGTNPIASFWRGVMRTGISEARLETTEVEAQGDLAVEVGRYTLTGADGGTVDLGKYVVVWHRAGAGWKVHRDIWTTSRPAPQA